MGIVAILARKTVRIEQVEPFAAVERRREARRARAGGQAFIISAIFTVPLHGVALYHHMTNSQ